MFLMRLTVMQDFFLTELKTRSLYIVLLTVLAKQPDQLRLLSYLAKQAL